MSERPFRHIDAHQHFWRYRPEAYGWISEAMPELRRDFLPGDLEPLLRAHGFDGSVAVQARMDETETDALLAFAASNPFIAGVIGWIDLRAADMDARLEAGTDIAVLKGYRHQVQDEASPADFLEDARFNTGVRRVLGRGMVYEVLIHEKDLPAAVRFCARNEGRLVLDHLGKPDARAGDMKSWKRRLKPLAELEHVSCKLSGLITEAAWRAWTEDELLPYCETVLELFGPDRLMFGSDWPVCLLSGTYDQVCTLAGRAVVGLSPDEREAVFGGTARRVYSIN